MWQTYIVTKLKTLNVKNSKTQVVTKLLLWKMSMCEEEKIKKGLLLRTFWHLDNRWDVLWAAFCDSRDVSYQTGTLIYKKRGWCYTTSLLCI